MAGARKCCCCVCDDGTKISADGTVEWITHSVSDGVITVVDHEGPCITYWVDSDAGDQTETGDGTELDPWININTVFADACINHICTHQDSPDGCPKVKILVKGTIDYTVDGGSYNYGRNLVFEPWGVATIEISVSGTGTICGVTSCVGVIWKNTNAEGISSNSDSYGFYDCKSSTFSTCIGTGTGTRYNRGFHFCNFSTFNTCTGTGTSASAGHSFGFSYSHASTFNTCTGTGSGSYYGYGFHFCHTSTFNTCTGTGSGGGYGNGFGFYDCKSSTFSTCIGTGTSVAIGYGFYDCSDLTQSSTFNVCDGVGILTTTPTNGRACGFYKNIGASFNACTTSESECYGTSCPANCDI